MPSPSPSRILVAEDDASVRNVVDVALRSEGHAVITANDGATALELIETQTPDEPIDLVVADIGMPHMNGLDLTRAVRRRGSGLPVLLLTARHEVSDRVDGLDAGADDYLVKPFAVEELLARTRALLRRHVTPTPDTRLEIEDLVLDLDGRTAMRGDEPIELTKTEFNLLELLVRNAGVVLSRDQLYEDIWGYEFTTDSKTLDVYIGYLRRKTEIDDAPRLIHTVRGVGYVARPS